MDQQDEIQHADINYIASVIGLTVAPQRREHTHGGGKALLRRLSQKDEE